MNTRNLSGFSARVRLQLRVGGKMLPLSQVGLDYCILKSPIDLPAQNAEVIADVDDLHHVRHIMLPSGTSQESTLVHFQECEPRTLQTSSLTAAAIE